jgi:hypothetical protein
MSSITSSANTLVDPEISDGAQLTFHLAVVAVLQAAIGSEPSGPRRLAQE